MSTKRNNYLRKAIVAVLAVMAIAGCERERPGHEEPVEAPKHLFSVAEGHQVMFSPGNLQYCTSGSHATAEGTAEGTFRFAEHQYDYLGQANAAVSDTNKGWMDLFCWGGSGWHVSPCSLKDGDYDIESLTGDEAFADWGVYNAIGDGMPGQWRTLTRDEWDYLVNRRAASTVDGTDSARYAEATVCGVAGLVILPDLFVRPANLAPMVNINSNNFAISFSDNTYTAEQWTLMEDAGAVFLPAAGFRGGTWLSTIGEGGSYWASTCNANRQAYALLFIDGLVNASAECTYDKDRGYGRSVRLVRDIDLR
ncbi:MAG: hypothetical protein K6E93_06155 [Bacteroidales bacterium]|nr:hypothetical protein [Bacteroidales bacterium]